MTPGPAEPHDSRASHHALVAGLPALLTDVVVGILAGERRVASVAAVPDPLCGAHAELPDRITLIITIGGREARAALSRMLAARPTISAILLDGDARSASLIELWPCGRADEDLSPETLRSLVRAAALWHERFTGDQFRRA